MDINKRKRTTLLISITFATFINPFMVSALGVALPTIGNDFFVSPGQLGLVETSYLMAGVILLLPIGKYADKIGLGRIYISGMIMFLIISIFIGISPTFNILIALRFVQGLSISMLTATGAAILTRSRTGDGFGVRDSYGRLDTSTGAFCPRRFHCRRRRCVAISCRNESTAFGPAERSSQGRNKRGQRPKRPVGSKELPTRVDC